MRSAPRALFQGIPRGPKSVRNGQSEYTLSGRVATATAGSSWR